MLDNDSSLLMFETLFGPQRFLVWSKENPLWRTFYRTTIAGHWAAEDIEEFNKAGCYYEIHLDHGRDEDAHTFCMYVMERCPNFKAAKFGKIAVNDMKVIVLLGRSAKLKDKINHSAQQFGFELARVYDRSAQSSPQEQHSRQKFAQYLDSFARAFRPIV